MDLMLYKKPYTQGTQDDEAGNRAWYKPVVVVAMTSGTITSYSPGRYRCNCAIVNIKEDNGGFVSYVHLKADPDNKYPHSGHVNAGTAIGEVGPADCTAPAGSNAFTAPHLHIQFSGANPNTPHPLFQVGNGELQKVMNQLWLEELPKK